MAFRIFLVLTLFVLANATITTQIASAMVTLDSLWQLNFVSRYGPPLMSCNCTYNGTFLFPCRWVDTFGGFACSQNGSAGYLDQLAIISKSLSTNFPAEILALDTLSTLQLSRTQLSGNVPSLVSLISLKILSLSHNALTGSLPDLAFAQSQSQVYLQDNLFTGSPNVYGAQPNLQILDLNTNLLSGPLVTNFVSGSGLSSLNLTNNALTGSVPDLSLLLSQPCDLRANNFDNCSMPLTPANCQISCAATCAGNPPVTGAVCIQGQWISPALNISGLVAISGPVTLVGNVSLTPDTVIVINSPDATLQVNGDVVLGGTLAININLTDPTFLPLINATTISGAFNNISGPLCSQVDPQQDAATFSVLITPNVGCQNKAAKIQRKIILIITFSVLGGLLAIFVALAFIAKYWWPTMPLVGFIVEPDSWR
jgi:hypothetical protein